MSDQETTPTPRPKVNQMRLGADLLQVEAQIMLARAAMLRGEWQGMRIAIMEARTLLGTITVGVLQPAESEYFFATQASEDQP